MSEPSEPITIDQLKKDSAHCSVPKSRRSTRTSNVEILNLPSDPTPKQAGITDGDEAGVAVEILLKLIRK